MTLVPPKDHKFAALHGAVWSGGSFVYVPEGVHVEIPLQSYFRLNAAGAGQFEHTLIIVEKNASLHFIEGCSAPKYNVTNLHAGCVELFVKEGARLRYSTIENWSRNMMNLNTKRALERLELRDVLTLERHRAGRDLILRMAHDDVHQRRFARAIRSENDVYFALVYRQTQALEDFLAFDTSVEILDFQKILSHI